MGPFNGFSWGITLLDPYQIVLFILAVQDAASVALW